MSEVTVSIPLDTDDVNNGAEALFDVRAAKKTEYGDENRGLHVQSGIGAVVAVVLGWASEDDAAYDYDKHAAEDVDDALAGRESSGWTEGFIAAVNALPADSPARDLLLSRCG